MYKFSKGSFYPYALRSVYEVSGTWPESGLDVDDDVFINFSVTPIGKVISTDEKGFPCWGDIPPPSKDDLIKTAGFELQRYRTKANDYITPLQDAVDLGIATENELVKLKRWKEYRVALNRLDINQAPDIEWPELPSN